jgi:hemolysin D
LLEKNFVSRHGYLEREQARIEQERDLAAQQAKLEEIRAALLESQRQRASLIAETRRATLDVLNLAEQKVASLSQDQVKAEDRKRLLRLTAPVAGSVQQLAVHTVGGVVTPAQALLVIVPGDNPLEIEAFVENKDIGFVRAGQIAEVKVETFPFTKYGTLHGKVMQVSSDAIQDEKRGLVYAARVKLEKTTLEVDGKTVNLTPGMAVTVEIKTGKRRVVEYFLSPLMQYGDESLRER